VRVVEVDPGEERLLAHRGVTHPLQSLAQNLVAPALDVAHAHRLVLREVEVVEVAVEALGDPPAVIEDIGGDEPAGRPAVRLQDLGQGHPLGSELEAAVVAHPVRAGEEPGHQRAVGRQGERGGGDGVLEPHPLGGQAVEVGGLHLARAVAAEAVGAGGVQSHQDEVQPSRRESRRERPQAAGSP